MKFTSIIFVILLILSVVCGYSVINNLKPTRCDADNFIVGTAAAYAPFVSINEKGDYEGFDIDVAQSLAQNMNKKLVIKDLGSMAPLFMALEQGTVDAIMWGLSITNERLKKVTMVRYQGETTVSYPLIFWQTIPAHVKSIEDMKGLTVCVEPTSSQDAVLSNYPSIDKKPTEKVDDALLNIRYGKTDAAFVEPAIAKKFKTKYPQIKVIDVPLAKKDQVQGVGIAIKKENRQLSNKLEQAVRNLQSSGIIKCYEEKWGLE